MAHPDPPTEPTDEDLERLDQEEAERLDESEDHDVLDDADLPI